MLGIVTVDDAIDAIIPERLKKQLPRFTASATRNANAARASVAARSIDARNWRVADASAAAVRPCSARASSRRRPATTSAASRRTRRPARKFGYTMLWTLVPLTVALIVVQEMAGRMGAVTGKGLAALIRENFGVRITFLAMAALFFINTVITRDRVRRHRRPGRRSSTSRATSSSRSRPWSSSSCFVLRFEQQDRRAHVRRLLADLPELHRLRDQGRTRLGRASSHGTLRPDLRSARSRHSSSRSSRSIGTTISPYMQFFLQSAVVEKGSRARRLCGSVRADIIDGSMLGIAIAGFMIIANAATIYHTSVINHKPPLDIDSAQAVDFARALKPLGRTTSPPGCSRSGSSTPGCSRRRCCRCRPPTSSAKRSASRPPSIAASTKRRSSTRSSGAGSSWAPGSCCCSGPRISSSSRFTPRCCQGAVLPLELVMMLVMINRRRVMGAFTQQSGGEHHRLDDRGRDRRPRGGLRDPVDTVCSSAS